MLSCMIYFELIFVYDVMEGLRFFFSFLSYMFNRIHQGIHLGLKVSFWEVFNHVYDYFYKYEAILIFIYSVSILYLFISPELSHLLA